jgi:hypothetical protein
MSMVRYSRKELNEKFSDKQDAEIQRLLAKGTVPDDQLDLSDILKLPTGAMLYAIINSIAQ